MWFYAADIVKMVTPSKSGHPCGFRLTSIYAKLLVVSRCRVDLILVPLPDPGTVSSSRATVLASYDAG